MPTVILSAIGLLHVRSATLKMLGIYVQLQYYLLSQYDTGVGRYKITTS